MAVREGTLAARHSAAVRKAWCRQSPRFDWSVLLAEAISTEESLVMALRSGLTATQVPVEMRPRQAGTPSNNPYKAAVYLVRSMFSLLVSLTRRPVKRNSLEDEK